MPLIGPTMDDLGRRVADRMRYNAVGRSGTIDPNANTITIHVASAATVPVTGACGGSTSSTRGSRSRRCAAGGRLGDAVAVGRRLRRRRAATGGTGGRAERPGPAARPAPRHGWHRRHRRHGRHRDGGGTGGSPCSSPDRGGAAKSARSNPPPADHSRADGDDRHLGRLRRAVPGVAHRLQLRRCRRASAPARHRRSPSTSTTAARQSSHDLDLRGSRHHARAPGRSLGDNGFATGWVWTKHTFTLPAPLARFFSPAARCRFAMGPPAAPTPPTSMSC